MKKSNVVLLGTIFAVAAVVFVYSAAVAGDSLPNGAAPIYVMSGFCVVVSLACFFRRSRRLTLRVIGTAICATCAWYLYRSLDTENAGRAAMAFAVFGIPGAYLAITGSYPSGAVGSAAFNAKTPAVPPPIKDQNEIH